LRELFGHTADDKKTVGEKGAWKGIRVVAWNVVARDPSEKARKGWQEKEMGNYPPGQTKEEQFNEFDTIDGGKMEKRKNTTRKTRVENEQGGRSDGLVVFKIRRGVRL